MDLSYSVRHQAFAANLRSFLDEHRELAPNPTRQGYRDPTVVAWQQLLIEHGYAARSVPVEYGGYGEEPDALISWIIAEEFHKAALPGGLMTQGTCVVVPTLLAYGTEEQKLRYIEPTIKGELAWCQGYSEPGAGSDLASLKTSAVVDGDDFIVNGQKIWTSFAHESDMMFCLVRTEQHLPRHRGITYLLVPMESPGIEVRPIMTMAGYSSFNEVFFTDVRVPLEQMVGERGQGWQVANDSLNHERSALGNPQELQEKLAAIVVLMQEHTLDSEPIMANPVMRDQLVQLQSRVLAMQFNNLRLMSEANRSRSPGVAALITKLQTSKLNFDLSAFAIDVMGEIGVLHGSSSYLVNEGAWQVSYMHGLARMIAGGTPQIQRNIIAERVLGLPREPKSVGTA